MGNSIFIVKFDSDIKLLVKSLTNFGFLVNAESSSCWKAYSSIKRIHPDAVVISLSKNEGQCRELIKNLRSSGSTSYVPLFLIDVSFKEKNLIYGISNLSYVDSNEELKYRLRDFCLLPEMA